MKKLLVFGTLLTVLAGSALAEPAVKKDGQWAKEHPRREEVNHRLNNQDKRIHKEVKEGEMTKAEAKNLHHQDRHIRHEERVDAAKNNGHITKAEDKSLNQQENHVSKEIGK